jgi:adenosylmethionine-8-amino-7-oxononanoate aminotransferase
METFEKFFGVGPEIAVRGDGPYVYNSRGNRYINGISGIWNLAMGQNREELVEAACAQMRELAFNGCWNMVHPSAIDLAAKLVEITGGHYQAVMFGSNGSDAVEASLKIARQYHHTSPNEIDHGRYKIFSLSGSYHGFSFGCISTSGHPGHQENFGPLVPGFVQIDPPYCYRCPYHQPGYPECNLACAQALEDKIREEGPETAAAFIIEPIMGDRGTVFGPDEYYSRIAAICSKYGLILVADEVTTGFGRTGNLFASTHWTLQPDILLVGKALSNGYFPISATMVTEQVYRRFRAKGNFFNHGVTHGGHPVGCAIALAAIKIITAEKLSENSDQVGDYLKSKLLSLAERCEMIGDVRGKGLMIAIELVKDRATKEPLTPKEMVSITNDIAVAGLLVGSHANVIQLMPPLTIDQQLADEIVRIITRGLDMRFLSSMSKKAMLLKEFSASLIRP